MNNRIFSVKAAAWCILLAVLFVSAMAPTGALSRPEEELAKGRRPAVTVPDGLRAEGDALLEAEGRLPHASPPVDTFCIVWYDFEPYSLQGWTVRDHTAEIDTFFHVDDFAGLDGGDYGRLVPIEGEKSAWCGVRPDTTGLYLCAWLAAPGYGNGWDQMLVTESFSFTSPLRLSFLGVFDSEEKFDVTTIEHSFNGGWTVIDSIDGVAVMKGDYEIFAPAAATKLRFHFVSDGAWSDQDGLHDTDGACIIDSITVSDFNGVIHYEDFESAATGDLDTDFWHCRPGREGFGSYTGLATNLEDKDPCGRNLTSQLVFFKGSTVMSDDYPGLPVTPYCAGAGGIEAPCQNVSVTSPVVDMLRYSSGRNEVQDTDIPPALHPHLGGAVLRFTVYSDLPLSNLVFYNWGVRNIYDGCPGYWMKRTSTYYGQYREYVQEGHHISDLVGDDPVQIRLQVFDMCAVWYGTYGDCAEHNPTPWFDNVRLYRYTTKGPQWSVRDLDLFQDTFPQDPSDIESFCRADMANDIAPGGEFDRIDPGDSAVVGVGGWYDDEPDTLPTGEAMVYFHCDVSFLGPDGKPDLTGSQLEGDYGTWQNTDGNGWDVFLCEPARTSPGNVASDKYCIDLNDSLLTRGYMVEYYFKAYGTDGFATTYPYDAELPGGGRCEFTCLPTLRTVPGVLYVDDYHGRGTPDGLVQLYYDQAFAAVCPTEADIPDRYDVNSPTSGVSNGIGAYVSAEDSSSIFSYAYSTVIHDSGDLSALTISTGGYVSDKSDDAQLYADWMNVTQHPVNLLVMGDDVGYDLNSSGDPIAAELMSNICGVTMGEQAADRSYYELTGGFEGGGFVMPLVTGITGTPFEGLSWYAEGGCPYINSFDVLGATGPGMHALRYPDHAGEEYYAGICTGQTNPQGYPMKTMWVGHSLMHMRDVTQGVPIRNRFLAEVFQFFMEPTGFDITGAEIPKASFLDDNFPNPFNPSTTVKFGLKEKGHVSIRIYDVSGRLVRILVDEIRDAGSYEAVWDGANRAGRRTASGIYFCRMETAGYERTVKMVQLR
jgi:hypothetical protein